MVTADAVASKLSSRLRTADAAVPQNQSKMATFFYNFFYVNFKFLREKTVEKRGHFRPP